MIYEWRCSSCGTIVEVTRTVEFHKEDPGCEHCMGSKWIRKISKSNPDFEHMYDKGILERVEKF